MGEPRRFTGTYGRSDAEVSAHAARQHGVLTLAQLKAHGLSPSSVHKRAASGRLHRVHPGVYALAPAELLGRGGRYLAAVLACGPDAALSHQSAAALRGLRASDRAHIDVTVPREAVRKHDGIDVHRSRTLTPADVTSVEGIPCTTVARTLLDLGGVLRTRALERAFEQAETLEVLDLLALEDQLWRNRHRRAAPVVRALLAEYDPSQGPTESELEESFLDLVRRAGLPAAERQAYIALDDGEPPVRADFAWRPQRLVIETDGRRYHRGSVVFESDRRKDQRLMLAGWRVTRITYRQVTREPQRIAALVTTLLRATA
jgi:hypothetical protein